MIMVLWCPFAYFYLPKSQVISQENTEHFLDNGMGWLQIRLHFWDMPGNVFRHHSNKHNINVFHKHNSKSSNNKTTAIYGALAMY